MLSCVEGAAIQERGWGLRRQRGWLSRREEGWGLGMEKVPEDQLFKVAFPVVLAYIKYFK